MATLLITEFDEVAYVSARQTVVPVGIVPPIAEQSVTYTTSAQSAAFNASTRFIRVIADADAHLSFGTNPTATASTQLIPANTEIWRMVAAGHKVSVYDGSS